jgi:Na+-translocating ferredoxin:NAD+ oxidoreductase subunit B
MTISIEDIDALLPQTQCTRCGFDGCKPYAAAILAGTPINQCPPGGSETIAALAGLLQRPALPLNPAHGVAAARTVAWIDESVCIGCTKCINVCPVDAIVGAAKRMHTVIAAECTGCALCVPACPVDCIAMPPDPLARDGFSNAQSHAARSRFVARAARLQRIEAAQAAQKESKRASLKSAAESFDLAAVLARAAAARNARK